MYRQLDSQQITATAQKLAQRIGERFPESGLSRVGLELCALSEASARRAVELRRSDWRVRALVGPALLAILAVAVTALWSALSLGGFASLGAEFFQGLEAAINDLIFFGVAVYFLVTLESRLKRRVALRALDELRSIAHIIDMHQLTKDPERVIGAAPSTPSSPARYMTQADLTRYLDYCSEMLSLTNKLAALHLQSLNDPLVLDSVNGIQALTLGLSGKIWQKIMILDAIAAPRQQQAPVRDAQ
jgi:hypothetical protein